MHNLAGSLNIFIEIESFSQICNIPLKNKFKIWEMNWK